MNHAFILNNNLPQSWETRLLGIEMERLRSEHFYALEDMEDKPANVTCLRTQICLCDTGVLGRSPTHLRREWIFFSLALCSFVGIPSIPLAIGISEGTIKEVVLYAPISPATSLKLYGGIKADFFIKMLLCLKEAYSKSPEKLEIIIKRYNRYILDDKGPDGLLDLSISLESLFSTNMEITFRFSLGLVKLIGYEGKTALQYFDLFKSLYDLRSRYVHGDPSYKKLHKQLSPHLDLLRDASRKALGLYVLYLKDNNLDTWDNFIKEKLVF